MFGYFDLPIFGKFVMGGGSKGKGYGVGKGSFGWSSAQDGKSCGKHAAGAGQFAGPRFDGTFDLSDEKLNLLSPKLRKQVVRSRSILLHASGPSYQAPVRRWGQASGDLKAAAGSDQWGAESWYQAKGPWVPCQNSQCPGCKKNGTMVRSFKFVIDVVE